MKQTLPILLVSTLLFASSCTKSSDDFTQTKALLQHKWTLISMNEIYRDKPSINRTYKYDPGNYYDFKANDTLVMTFSVPHVSSAFKYTLRSRSVFTFGYGTPVKMVTLTDDLLVLQQDATGIIMNGRNHSIYHGIRIDTLQR